MATKDWEPQKILKKHVISAAKRLNQGPYKTFKKSISYDVLIGGKPYPPKAISSCAHEFATGRSLSPQEFGGAKDGIWHRRLKDLGFDVVEKRPLAEFDAKVAAALKKTPEFLAKQLALAPSELPTRREMTIYRFNRRPEVVAARLQMANGTCEECGKPAPFARKRNGEPYLEVHHVKPLSKGGADVVSNTKAVCPNCHCKIHDQLDLELFDE